MHGRVGIILQARLASERLPGKALATLGGTPILTRCLDRLRLAAAGEVVLATTESPDDDALVMVARRLGVSVHRGSTSDVLGRFVETALWHQFDVVIRATGDNPGVDIDAANRLLDAYATSSAEYVCEDGLPCGAGVELITTAALTRVAALASAADDREHVTTYVKRHPGLFRCARLAPPAPLQRPDIRLTVDTGDDLAFMRRVFARARSIQPALATLIAAADSCSRSHAA